MKESLQARADEGKCPLKVRTYGHSHVFYQQRTDTDYISFRFWVFFVLFPTLSPHILDTVPFFLFNIPLCLSYISSLVIITIITTWFHHHQWHYHHHHHHHYYHHLCGLWAQKSKEITLSEIPVDNDYREASWLHHSTPQHHAQHSPCTPFFNSIILLSYPENELDVSQKQAYVWSYKCRQPFVYWELLLLLLLSPLPVLIYANFLLTFFTLMLHLLIHLKNSSYLLLFLSLTFYILFFLSFFLFSLFFSPLFLSYPFRVKN